MSGINRTKRFAILLGGEAAPTDRLRRQAAGRRAIAADGGMAHAAPLGLQPELWVGDFNSTPPRLLAAYGQVAREVHSPDKAKTDGELAIDAAMARGADDLLLVGALGGRTDQMLGHLAMALRFKSQGVSVFASSGREEAHALVPGVALTLDLPAGATFSVIPFMRLSGLTITGARWPLHDASVNFGSTRAISNVAAGGEVVITTREGEAIVVARPEGE